MVIFSRGADPDALERSADLFRGYAAEGASIRAAAGTAVATLQGQWSGGDLDALTGRWPGVGHQIDLAGTTLVGLEKRLRSNAAAQRVTSGGGPGTGAGPAIGHTTPKHEKHWWDSVLDTAGDVGAWTYNHTVVPVVNGLADVGQAMIEHPEDILGLVSGAGMILLGGAGEVGGGLLDATGVGAVVGVPVNVAAAALIAAGAGTMAMSAGDLASNAAQNDNHVLSDAQGPSSTLPPSTQGSVEGAVDQLPMGHSPGVRIVGSDQELGDLYGRLSQGGTPFDVPGYKGSWIELPDGTRLGLREVSKSGGRTIDIRYPDGTTGKVHVS